MKKFFLTNLLILFLFNQPSYAKDDKIVYSLFLAGDKNYAPYVELTEYINKKTNRKFKTEFITDYHQAGKIIFDKSALLGFLCSGPYTALKDKYSLEVLAAIKPSYSREYKSYIIVPKDSTAKNLKDLKGKSFAYVDLLSYTGRVTTIYEIMKLNEDPLNFFSSITYSKTHGNSIELVADKKVDGAAVMSLIYENIIRRNPKIQSKIKIIGMSQRAGFPVFVTNKYNDKKIIEELKNVLLNMHKDTEGKKILNSLDIDNLYSPNLSDYSIIEEHINHTRKYIPY